MTLFCYVFVYSCSCYVCKLNLCIENVSNLSLSPLPPSLSFPPPPLSPSLPPSPSLSPSFPPHLSPPSLPLLSPLSPPPPPPRPTSLRTMTQMIRVCLTSAPSFVGPPHRALPLLAHTLSRATSQQWRPCYW